MVSDKYPEAEGRDLSEFQKKLSEDGWCVIPDVLPAEKTKEALDRLWKAAEESRKRGTDTYMPTLDPNASNIRVFYLMELDEIFRDLIAHPTAISMVKSLIGDEILVSNFTANIARPGSGSMGLHSDLSLKCPDPWTKPWMLNIIWCLTDTNFANGSTLYIPGSHKWTTASDVPADAVEKLVPFEAKAGSIVAMDGRLWHTSGKNITEGEDRALLFGAYNAAFLRGQVNWSVALSEETKKTLSPEVSDWLGCEIVGNIGRVKGVNSVAYGHKEEGVAA